MASSRWGIQLSTKTTRGKSGSRRQMTAQLSYRSWWQHRSFDTNCWRRGEISARWTSIFVRLTSLVVRISSGSWCTRSMEPQSISTSTRASKQDQRLCINQLPAQWNWTPKRRICTKAQVWWTSDCSCWTLVRIKIQPTAQNQPSVSRRATYAEDIVQDGAWGQIFKLGELQLDLILLSMQIVQMENAYLVADLWKAK